ncbi:hypothetical protein LMTR13_08640 [Bradyrhizobium icense]|uniref:Uncharacterized protein n=1 Tax=Bradyrhizobium icense TaxID=1274631 RepID=A0A1B1UBS7_9BRAD|nr:hypothetical protein LMTR13_08640 [Bradyrhizobium icense]
MSILMRVVGAVGRCRGVQPRSNTSMMIMRPPQHGSAAPLGSLSGFATVLQKSFCFTDQKLCGL